MLSNPAVHPAGISQDLCFRGGRFSRRSSHRWGSGRPTGSSNSPLRDGSNSCERSIRIRTAATNHFSLLANEGQNFKLEHLAICRQTLGVAGTQGNGFSTVPMSAVRVRASHSEALPNENSGCDEALTGTAHSWHTRNSDKRLSDLDYETPTGEQKTLISDEKKALIGPTLVVLLALALSLCNADRVIMSMAIMPLSAANGWPPSVAGVVQVRTASWPMLTCQTCATCAVMS